MISGKNYVVLDQKIYIIGVIPILEHRVPHFVKTNKRRQNGRTIFRHVERIVFR